MIHGHIDRFWADEHRMLSYTRPVLNEKEATEWSKLGHNINTIGVMYDSKNPMPDWVSNLSDMFGLTNQTYTFYRMDTRETMPVHSDHYRTYQKLNNCTVDEIWRCVLMLEDWSSGHYLEVDGTVYGNWKAGDYFMWQGTTPHAAANIGLEPRYTLQITGLKRK